MGKSKKHDSKSKSKHKRKEKKSKKRSKEKKRLKEVKRKQEKIPLGTSMLNDDKSTEDFAIPLELMNSKSHAPETPEEYKQRQNRIRRETDPVTGRSRLIKGDSEVIEEIVSKERHNAINKNATKGDGEYFQGKTVGKG